MRIGLVGFQGSGKSTLFELLTGVAPDAARAHAGQLAAVTLPDRRFDRLIGIFQPKKIVPARIDLFDTPGLERNQPDANAGRLAIIREASTLLLVLGEFGGHDPGQDVATFHDELMLADLGIVTGRIARLRVDVVKPRPDREKMLAELETLEPLEAILDDGRSLAGVELTPRQQQAARGFSLLTLKPQLVLVNTADTGVPAGIDKLGPDAIAAPVGLELELASLDDSERAEFAEEMGFDEPCRDRLLDAVFKVADLVTFYTCCDREVHAWLLPRGATAVEAADAVHSDLARGFIRAEIMPADRLVELGSERAVREAGFLQVEGREYQVRDGDVVYVRSGV